MVEENDNDIVLEKQADDEEPSWSGKPIVNKKKEPSTDGRKKERTPAQLAAFQKMRENRLKQMKEAKEKPVLEKKKSKPKIIEGDSDPSSDDEPVVRRKSNKKKAQIVNHYYYGGIPPQMMMNQLQPEPKQKPEPEPEPKPEPKPEPIKQEKKKPKIQFA